MFDVACGECELVDFLLTRFDPIDLKTKIRFDPSAQVDEQLAPPKEEEQAPLVVEKPAAEPIPLQLNLRMPPPPGSQTEAADPNDGFRPATAVSPADGEDVLETTEETEEELPTPEHPAVVSTPMGPDWLTLHQRFQEAAQRYQEELAPGESKEDEPS